MRSGVSHKGIEDGGEMSYKRKVFAAGKDIMGSIYRPNFYRVFIILVSLHTSIFLIPYYPQAGIILALAVLKGWLNA